MESNEELENKRTQFELEISEKTIDLENVMASKNPKLARRLPRFVKSYLKKIIHEDMINRALFKHKEKFGLEFASAILDEIGVQRNFHGLENIPETGRFIFAANHPLGGPDGMALMQGIGERRKDIFVTSNDILMFLPNLRELFIPINKHGKNIDNKRIIDEAFASDKVIMFFPAGLVSRKTNGIIEDLEWKITFLSKAIKNQRDIIPVYISGRNSNFFYNLANLRKKLGIKINIEMLYLVDEMVKQRNIPINITFGKPIPYTYFDKSKKVYEWAQLVKRHVYAMGRGEESPIKF